MNTPTAMKTKKVSVTKSVPKKGVSSSKRLTMVKQAISMKMAFSGEKDKIKISADKVTIIPVSYTHLTLPTTPYV